jgi:hypothetical protein
MTQYTRYGPGDPQTWGPCTGHPGDPRTDDHFPPEDDEEPEEDNDSENDNEDEEPESLRHYLDHCSSSERDEEDPDNYDLYDHEPSSN